MLLLFFVLISPTNTQLVRWDVQTEIIADIKDEYTYVKIYHKGKLAANFFTNTEMAEAMKRACPKLNGKTYNREYILELIQYDYDVNIMLYVLADALQKDRIPPVVVPNWLNFPKYDPFAIEIEMNSWKLNYEK